MADGCSAVITDARMGMDARIGTRIAEINVFLPKKVGSENSHVQRTSPVSKTGILKYQCSFRDPQYRSS